MKNYKSNPAMNGAKSDVTNLTTNEIGNRLRAELSALPHADKDNEIHLATPAHIKVLSFLIDKGFVWTGHIVRQVAYNCFVNSRNGGKPFWTVVDYKIL